MIICILDKETKQVINRIIVDFVDQYIPKDNEEISDAHDGDIGWIRTNNTWVNPNETPVDKAKEVRLIRDKLLVNNIDIFNSVRWSTLTQEQQAAWTNYRQELLNVPQQEGFPDNVIWPVLPDQEIINVWLYAVQ